MRNYNDYESLLAKYPYFAYAALKAIPLAPDDECKDAMRRIVAVNIGDPADAAEVLGLNSESLADFYPDALPPKLSTFDTIDTFLSTFGSEPRETAVEKQSSIPVAPEVMHPDLIAASAAMDQSGEADDLGNSSSAASASDSTASAIDAFLAAVPPPAPRRRRHEEMPKEEESPALTESFARILIKNRNYEKALQIIQDLNLKNPEKSVYFADQIRFLKKLILNESRKNH